MLGARRTASPANATLAGTVLDSLGHFVAVDFTGSAAGGDYEYVRYDVVVREADGTRDDVDFSVLLF